MLNRLSEISRKENKAVQKRMHVKKMLSENSKTSDEQSTK